jgi:hypothetical protein
MGETTVTLDQAIETAMQLPPEQRAILLEVLRSRQIESRRQEIAEDAQESMAIFKSGHLKPQSAAEVIQELHQTLQEPE